MASIYESRDPSVELRGPQDNVGFQPVQAFDPSRSMLSEGERRIQQAQVAGESFFRNQSKDIEGLVQFSETLGKFMVQRAEEDKKNKIASGYAKFIRGETTINPKAQEDFRTKAAVLEVNANKDIAVAQGVATSGIDPGAASTIMTTSPALRGWEAYGSAVAQAQLAPANLETFLTSNKRRASPVLLEDGRQVIPADAKGYEIADVTRALTKEWVREYGLDRINPQIIQEHGGFNLAMAEREVLRSWMKESDEREIKTFQYNTLLKVANTLPQALTVEGAAEWQNTSYPELLRAYNGDPVIANESQLKAIEQQLAVYRSTKDTTSMDLLIKNLEVVPIAGTGMTFGGKNAAKFREFKALLVEARKERSAQFEDEEKKRLDIQYQQFQLMRRTGTPEQVRKESAAFRASLTQSSSPYAMELQNKLSKEDGSLRLKDQVLAQIRGGNKKPGGGFLWTSGSIDKLVASEDLEEADAEEIKKLLPDIPSVTDLGKGIGDAAVITPVRGALLGRLAEKGRTYGQDAGFKARIDGALFAASRVAYDTLSSKWQAQFDKTGKWPNDTIVQREWAAELERIISLPSEEFYIDSDGDIPNRKKKGLPTGGSLEIKSPVASPAELQALRRQAGPFPTIQATAVRIDPDDFDLYQAIIAQGGTLPVEIAAAARMVGISEDSYMAYQASQLPGKTYVPNTDKQATYQRNAAINLNAANTIRNPRSSTEQIRGALQLISSGGTRRPERASTSAFGQLAGDFGGVAELTSSGEGGFNSVNTGKANDFPKGMPLTSMRIGDIQKLQKRYNATKGREGVFAVGFAQWVSTGQFDMAVKSAGLGPDDLLTPENQLRMFWSYILKSDKRPDLRDYLLGKHNDLNRAQEAFAFEWAAAPGVNGKGKYDNDDAGNKATIDRTKLRTALVAAKRELKQYADSGIDPLQ